ncbi:2-succinyl-5-enolpyruvyl-6-hydroxy-3-cyclohexene-1-carboxylic-acid synthase [Paenarthrobacter sp. DKR-5]|uniref:2-succinyl-5-enolpyruvyl-6-hydroxy-3- cyclohexene-1-carboxylic-acid synthase n=1 Tax=Paenarthrobacter sp. DKR-5 TaxID=2835535 RepID=UPI001BDCE8EC|nr:2-succinyl-5-enolpyruvyl-6-hydroxy-3-cyclohexene-1-carboxylic-acid synthase [Paenarthrobacter sp. DKR-5]MBT1001243.1 2-succinyl-5-enolpyruvyl-6-hydroxy-3-cyclohexene-1-carboxylic-acid synthase [Paenarthrobacter sp. DKR-5]
MTESLGSVAAARLAVQALIDGGVGSVVVAPGSRSAPLAYALAAAEAAGRLRLHVRIDERDAAFTALGLALGSGRPVAVVTTSGTAVGNLLPAVMEANHAAVPLIVLSADRPEELRGTGANQTTDQAGLFGTHVRYAVDVAAGADPGPAVREGLAAARGGNERPAGPVQLNLAFRDPLVPGAAEPVWVPEPTPPAPDAGPDPARTAANGGLPAPEAAVSGRSAEGSRPRRRTVVVAGHAAGPVAETFARRHGLPLLAEPSSNARFGPLAIGPYRLLLGHIGPDIERVVVFGRPTLSRPVAALLARTDVERALYLPGPAAWFTPGRRPEHIISDLDELGCFAGDGEDGWLERWQRAGAEADAAVSTVLAAAPGLTGLHVARAVWGAGGADLVLGSSNPIRDVDLTGTPAAQQQGKVYANRGLAGIDGTVATASGISLATGRPVRALLGDLTFLHDAGGLLLGPGEPEPQLQLVVFNDGGGGIFSTLEHGALGEHAAYTSAVERLFGTPQRADLRALAAAYGLEYAQAADAGQLGASLAAPVAGRSVFEVRGSRAGLRALHAGIRAAVASAVG